MKHCNRIGSIVIILGLIIFINQLVFLTKSLPAIGTVTSLNLINNAKSYRGTFVPNTFYPSIEFSTNNKKYLFSGSILAGYLNYHPYKLGEKISVLYEKNNPNIAIIDNSWELWVKPVFLFIFGIVLCILIPLLKDLIKNLIQS